MKERANKEIRDLVEKKRIKYWELAVELGISEATMTRWLRTELPAGMKEKIISAINAIRERID